MAPVLTLLLSVPIAGAIFYRVLDQPARQRLGVFVILLGTYAWLPLLVSSQDRLQRALMALLVSVIFLKLYDAHVEAQCGAARAPLRKFLAAMFNVFVPVARKQSSEPRVLAAENLKRLFAGIVQIALGYTLLKGLFIVDWAAHGFLVEHVVKSMGFFIGVVGLFQASAAIARFLGVVAREPSVDPYTATTPAIFWRQYNRVMGQFLYENIYQAIGRRRPIFGILIAFLLSGLVHEYMFSITVGRILGYQTAFFLLQGFAVVATQRIRPRGWQRIPWWIATLSFNIATSLLFLANLHHITPFYANPLPWGL